ncbi:MAG: sugar ABC transporter ATP-binding protein [Vicinamibacteria bacterium]
MTASEPRPPDGAEVLRMTGIRKAYPGVAALAGVDFDLRRGEVHVLLGENGAGKSTLMKILSGATPRDSGGIRLDGVPVEIASPRQAQRLGVRTIYQELNLVPRLSVAENVFLGREPGRFGVLDRARMRAETARVLGELGLRIDPAAIVGDLGIAQRQMVEVAKAISEDARVLIMDEPTSSLTETEIHELFAAIARLTARGVGVIYISHRLEEVARVGHRVTVLRDGQLVATRPVADVTVPELVRLMANRDLKEHFPRQRTQPGEELLRVEDLRRGKALRGVSLVLCRGEVVGIAGLLGAGRSELARAIFGADRPESGRVLIKGREVRVTTPEDGIGAGLGLLPEDRKTEGLVLGLSVRDNVALPNLGVMSRMGVVARGAEDALATRYVADLRVKTPGIGQRVGQLSGGNQQKVVLAKWLAAKVDVLIMDEPTRGIDVAAKVEIYELMNRLTAQGAGILMISSELPEVLGMSDRILVMHQGRLAAELTAAEASQERVLHAALGQAS